MSNVRRLLLNFNRLATAGVLAMALAGCATNKIDWAARVGTYTLDQAKLDLGPPDKEAKLSDGTVVAEWLTRRGYYYSHPIGGFYGPYGPWCYGPFYPGYIDSYSPDYYLRLTFGPDGRLTAWKKFAK
jgi:hypothetical protein